MSAVGSLGGAPLAQDSAPSSALSVWQKPGAHRVPVVPVHSWASWDLQVDLWKRSLQVPTAEKGVNSGILYSTVKLFLIIKHITWNLKGKAYLPTISPAQKFTDKLFLTARIFRKSIFFLLNSYIHSLLPQTFIPTGWMFTLGIVLFLILSLSSAREYWYEYNFSFPVTMRL